MEKEERRVICSWCNRIIKEGVEPVTHGICPKCADVVMEEIDEEEGEDNEDQRKKTFVSEQP